MCTVGHSRDSDPWSQRLARWSRRLRAAHLDGLVGALLEAVEPLGPLGAQVLWVAQPTLGLWVPRDEIATLAQRLEAPGGVAWLREQLIEMDDHDQ
jgi:hypothetical protein